MTPHVFFGWCTQCNSPKYVQAFSLAPVVPYCDCSVPFPETDAETQALMAAVDHGKAFDGRVKELQILMIQDEAKKPFDELLAGARQDLLNAVRTFEQGDHKDALAFLVRVSAMVRYAVADRPELDGVRDVLRRSL